MYPAVRPSGLPSEPGRARRCGCSLGAPSTLTPAARDREKRFCFLRAPRGRARCDVPAGIRAGTRLLAALASLALTCVLVVLGGCLVVPASKVNTSREVSAPVVLGEGRKIAVLYSADFAPLVPQSLGSDMVECIQEAVRAGVPEVTVLTQEQFFPLIFPGLSTRQVLIRADTIPALVARDEIRRRLEEAKIDYLLLVAGQPEDRSSTTAGGGGAPSGFIVFHSWDRRADMQATMFDLRHGAQVATSQASARGQGFVVAPMGIPLGGGVSPEGPTCKALGGEVVRALLSWPDPDKK